MMNMHRHLILVATLGLVAAPPASAQDATVIELTQTGCQFLEAENDQDHGYSPQKKSDCETINAQSGDSRLAAAKTIRLKPGKYVFRVSNRNVPYALGFWLRGDGLINRARLPSKSGGGLTPGASRDYAIELPEGDYVYSCPLNPTPDYRLVVEG